MEKINDEFTKLLSNFKETKNKELRTFFKDYIKPNLLIRLKEEILNDKQFDSVKHTYPMPTFTTLTSLGFQDIEVDICKNMSMINWFNTLPIYNDLNEKAKLYNDVKYHTELKNKTIQQCRLHNLIFEETNLMFAHAPINYAMHCVVNYLLDRLEYHLTNKHQSSVKNANFKINSIKVMLKTIKSILILIDNQDYGNAYSLLRTLIEHTLVYLAIYDNEEVADQYYKFMGYRMYYESTGEYPKEIITSSSKNIQKKYYHNYLNFGWIDAFSDNKQHNYVLKDLINYISKVDKNYCDGLLVSYKYCCKYSHANYINQSIPDHPFLWILIRSGEILVNILKQHDYIFEDESIYENINLCDYLIEQLDYSQNIYEKLFPKE